MIRRNATSVLAIVLLVAAGSLEAHHSISMFDITAPIWIRGTVVRYEPVNPHAIVALDVTSADGQVRRWMVEGPTLRRLERMGVRRDFLEVGDAIEICGFPLKEAVTARMPKPGSDDLSPPFMHGHMLVLPDGQRRLFGPYGKLDNCVRPADRIEAWIDFLNADSLAREAWCDRPRASLPTRDDSRAAVDEIRRRTNGLCD